MNPNLLPTPKFIPGDVVISYEHFDSRNPVPLVSRVEYVFFNEDKQAWYCHLSIGWKCPESKLASYQRGIFISKGNNP